MVNVETERDGNDLSDKGGETRKSRILIWLCILKEEAAQRLATAKSYHLWNTCSFYFAVVESELVIVLVLREKVPEPPPPISIFTQHEEIISDL
jgi:hypothetical protein